jgi:hypothetical protein
VGAGDDTATFIRGCRGAHTEWAMRWSDDVTQSALRLDSRGCRGLPDVRSQIAGVEGASSYGAGLARILKAAEIEVAEVSHPYPAARRRQGKSDPLDPTSPLAAHRPAMARAGPGAFNNCKHCQQSTNSAVS